METNIYVTEGQFDSRRECKQPGDASEEADFQPSTSKRKNANDAVTSIVKKFRSIKEVVAPGVLTNIRNKQNRSKKRYDAKFQPKHVGVPYTKYMPSNRTVTAHGIAVGCR